MPKVLPVPTGGSTRGRTRRVATTLAEINVIPLVDVMLVLLIIFMVAAPMLQKGVEVNLPVAGRTTEISSERVFLDVPRSFSDDRRVFIEKEPIRIDFLAERIRQIVLNRSDKTVYLRGDGAITYQELMEVIDRLKEAGITNIGMITALPGER
jgi:biopolymer transport protein TolR